MVFNISVTVSGSTAVTVVCVETEGAASVKSILRDAKTALSEIGPVSNVMLCRPT